MSPFELGFDERGDVDVVDDEVADEPGDVHVDEPRVDDLHLSQVAVAEGRAGEVGAGEPGAAELVGILLVIFHPGSRLQRARPAD